MVTQGAGVSHQPLDGSMPQLGSLERYKRAGTSPEGTGSTFKETIPHNRKQQTKSF